LRSLFVEKQKWIVCARMLNTNYSSVNGDVSLAAAMVIFGGGFTEKYRQILQQKWLINCLKPVNLKSSENFKFVEVFGDNFKIRNWRQNGLPEDSIVTDNALIMEKTGVTNLCIDP
jgi:dynein heavy chain 1, cytosolic